MTLHIWEQLCLSGCPPARPPEQLCLSGCPPARPPEQLWLSGRPPGPPSRLVPPFGPVSWSPSRSAPAICPAPRLSVQCPRLHSSAPRPLAPLWIPLPALDCFSGFDPLPALLPHKPFIPLLLQLNHWNLFQSALLSQLGSFPCVPVTLLAPTWHRCIFLCLPLNSHRNVG